MDPPPHCSQVTNVQVSPQTEWHFPPSTKNIEWLTYIILKHKNIKMHKVLSSETWTWTHHPQRVITSEGEGGVPEAKYCWKWVCIYRGMGVPQTINELYNFFSSLILRAKYRTTIPKLERKEKKKSNFSTRVHEYPSYICKTGIIPTALER